MGPEGRVVQRGATSQACSQDPGFPTPTLMTTDAFGNTYTVAVDSLTFAEGSLMQCVETIPMSQSTPVTNDLNLTCPEMVAVDPKTLCLPHVLKNQAGNEVVPVIAQSQDSNLGKDTAEAEQSTPNDVRAPPKPTLAKDLDEDNDSDEDLDTVLSHVMSS